ncbi:MAG TPA: hypothetical protein VIU11_25460 [Nakamurella sp.]
MLRDTLLLVADVVTWQSNTGVTGSTTLSATGNDALDIGEYRIVLVQGPGG